MLTSYLTCSAINLDLVGSTEFRRCDQVTSVRFVRYQASTTQIRALTNGELDIALLGFSSLPLAIENAGMEDLRGIVGKLQDGVVGYYSNEYAVLADGPIHNVEDLKGKVLATNGLGSGVDIGMRAMANTVSKLTVTTP
jgi:ABC-type nitrate/sulfonate/bicarbonate transport system substrate-binding protein